MSTKHFDIQYAFTIPISWLPPIKPAFPPLRGRCRIICFRDNPSLAQFYSIVRKEMICNCKSGRFQQHIELGYLPWKNAYCHDIGCHNVLQTSFYNFEEYSESCQPFRKSGKPPNFVKCDVFGSEKSISLLPKQWCEIEHNML